MQIAPDVVFPDRKPGWLSRGIATTLASLLGGVLVVSDVQAVNLFSGGGATVTNSVASPNGVTRTGGGGTFDLHAVAEVAGALPTPIAVAHFPSQSDPFFRTFFPLKSTARAYNPINPRVPSQGIKLIGGYSVEQKPPAGKSYDTEPKSETGPNGELILHDPAIAGPVRRSRTIVNPTFGPFSSSAEAQAKITFTDLGNNRIRVSAAGSYATVDKSGSRFDPTIRDFVRAPEARAASLVRDPMSFNDIQADDFLEGDVSLKASDFNVVFEPDSITGDIASSVLEVGTDIAGAVPGAIGLDSDGHPLLFRLGMTFNPDGSMGALLDLNEELLNSGNLLFLDPLTNSLAFSSASEASTYIADKLLGELQFDTATSAFSLAHDLDLFKYQVRAAAAMPVGNVGVLMGNAVFVNEVPEPASLLLMLSGLSWVYGMRRRRH
ncbi:putative secreted protein with PEP-CTERM sorting signal [Plasticicumulans lactativorans]|uniref:Putative secreted protein with PEP-CTERM sorting signal n=1 Tax=Plasticicumulans lactativorans TaxID=1133106 RepID=A0A4R2LP63_9GAMM|nr:PEP-CTERM sorting domain-containing protein [Plasticicumulans lactativorans]TCO81268.1 putative secreted protein with PEP-CTERM sorting signal [Plasticicumulans lactativorans]